jgi:hypothetical protein
MTSSKMVRDRERAAAIVIQATVTHADQVGAQLDQQLAPLPPGGGDDNTAALIRRLGQTLQVSIDGLVAADRAHELEKADDPGVRQELEDSVEAVYREVVDFRAGLEAATGTAGTTSAGLVGATPHEPVALARLGQALVGRLPELASVPATRRGVAFDAMSYSTPLSTALDRMALAQQAVRREQRELEVTMVAKNRVMAAHDACFLNIARTLESLFRLAGFQELADRVRPSTRRPGLVENDPDRQPAPPAPDAGQPAPGPDAP